MRLHYKACENENIEYVDVMSLYPYICNYFKFPVGHPFIQVGEECKDEEACLRMDGLIKYSIVPPQRLHNPVPPFKCNKNLIFYMCRSCALTSASGKCKPTEDEKEPALTVTCVLDEVRLAVEKGYKILEIYEVYEYKVTQFNPESDEGGLFADYIITFLKLKAQASGYPGRVRSPEDEELYDETFRESEVIRLDKKSIRGNAAKCGLVKLCLNSMWGNLTERNYWKQTKVISEPKELFRFRATPSTEVLNLMFANDNAHTCEPW